MKGESLARELHHVAGPRATSRGEFSAKVGGISRQSLRAPLAHERCVTRQQALEARQRHSSPRR